MNKLNKYIYILSAIFIANLFSLSVLRADHRKFVWTYEYMTLPKNTAELETYQTFSIIDLANKQNSTLTELNLEFEVGMTDFWDVGVYQVFSQNPDNALKYDGFKVRNRFKIGKENQFWLDPLIYIEYVTNPSFTKHEFEPKLVLAKTIGNFSFSLNPYCEIDKEDEEWEFTPKYALGLTYGITRILNFGVEVKGDKNASYIGPTISHGSEDFWFSFGSCFALGSIGNNIPKIQTRLLMGFQL